ncbi:hypothetical protein D8I30_13155 [Brevundimonas naejangsanensis]|uniref:Uncharacterized protein n=1 Tax=Brevundimonas naejangsanensis TaxID=588932 RepID=A0A494RKM1_9CAUL|nr:hypothetical protein [Brevundimonas naejangsanensis]AYG96019.1 hypothetical protein D8I30_13155 [Brevundimonas naejangsanensis]
MPITHIVERAFQIAESDPACLKVGDITAALAIEGYGSIDRFHLDGNVIRAQLRKRIALRLAKSA